MRFKIDWLSNLFPFKINKVVLIFIVMTQWLNSKNIEHQNNWVKIQINIETIII